MFCGNCGNELREGAKFCPKCGAMTRLARQQEQPQAEPEQAMPPVIPEPEPVLAPGPVQEPAIEGNTAPAESAPPEQVRRQRPAAGKAKPAVRLKAMPVKPAQEAQPTRQAEPAKPVSPPPAPEAMEPPQQPVTPAQPSILETGAARLASAVGSVKDAMGGGSVQCGSCGTKLKAGTKFCPECGAAVTQPPKEEPAPAPDGQNSKGTAFGAPNQSGGTAPENREGQMPEMDIAVETKPKAAPNKGRIIFFAAAGVFVVVIALLAALGSGNINNANNTNNTNQPSYADGLVEANNEFGLSTTITLEEFVERYNDASVRLGLDSSMSRIDLEDGQVLDSTPGITEYQFMFPLANMTRLKQGMDIAVDNETGYVVMACLRFSASAYNSISTTDTQRRVVVLRGSAILAALFDADEQRSRAMELMNSPQGVVWEKGIVYIGNGSVGEDAAIVGFQTMTKEVYEEKYGQ